MNDFRKINYRWLLTSFRKRLRYTFTYPTWDNAEIDSAINLGIAKCLKTFDPSRNDNITGYVLHYAYFQAYSLLRMEVRKKSHYRWHERPYSFVGIEGGGEEGLLVCADPTSKAAPEETPAIDLEDEMRWIQDHVSPRSWTAIRLHHLDGLTLRAAAEVMDITESGVLSIIKSAAAELRRIRAVEEKQRVAVVEAMANV